MREPDYSGDMKFFQDQLARRGITKDMLDMDRFAGLTFRELQNIVDCAYVKRGGAAGEVNAQA